MPSTTVTASHVTQGRVEYESTIPQHMDDGLDLWEANLMDCTGSSFYLMTIIYHFLPVLFHWCRQLSGLRYFDEGADRKWKPVVA